MTAPRTIPFADAVAERSGHDAVVVSDVLARHNVVAAPRPPVSRPLSVRHIAFTGEKVVEGVTSGFSFQWDVDKPGLWALASVDNFVGKSTVLQVVLWALRGRRKRLTGTVTDWLRSVAVSFRANDAVVEVAFDVVEGDPVGKVRLVSSQLANELSFYNADQFRRTMQDVMLEALGLEPIGAASKGHSGRVSAFEDGWLAYTGAFLSDSHSDAIIGENQGTDLTQRLLQVYLGLPWATTLFQARSRFRQLEAEAGSRTRQLAALGNKSLQDIEGELAAARAKVSDEAARNKAASNLVAAQDRYDQLALEVRQASRDVNEANADAADATSMDIRAEQVLLALRENQAASVFFRRLSPVCCPRCDRAIDDERRKLEQESRKCSVCTSDLPPAGAADLQAEQGAAEDRSREAKRYRENATRAVAKRQETYERLRSQLFAAGEALGAAATNGNAADAHVLARKVARLEGIFEVANSIVRTDAASEVDLAVLKSAVEEATDRVAEASDHVMSAASTEVTRIVKLLGMREVNRVVLKRNAHVDIHQAAGTRSWGELAAGEQLRLRLATVIALVHTSHTQGFGRHPGLLLIDSPGTEEMNADRLGDYLNELSKLATTTEGLQVFVALQGPERLTGVIPSERTKSAGPGEYLW